MRGLRGGSICALGKSRAQSKDCRGASICKHNRVRNRCKDCGGTSICEHNPVEEQMQFMRELAHELLLHLSSRAQTFSILILPVHCKDCKRRKAELVIGCSACMHTRRTTRAQVLKAHVVVR